MALPDSLRSVNIEDTVGNEEPDYLRATFSTDRVTSGTRPKNRRLRYFFPEIAHGMPIHLVYFFCLKVLFFSRKKIKIDTTPHY